MTQQAVKAPPFVQGRCNKCRHLADELDQCPKCGGWEMTIKLNCHPGQSKTWFSKKGIVAMLAGAQSGKTVFGPHWLEREIREKGAGDYLIATASFTLLDKTLLKEFKIVFEDIYHYGTYNEQRKLFTFFQKDTVRDPNKDNVLFPDSKVPTRIIIGSAQNPESLESATVKGVWLDECGQNQFKRETWEAIRRRTFVKNARVLMTTTLYGLGWLKTEIYDPWLNRTDPDIDVIQFDSIENPVFPREKYELMKAIMPSWKFDLFHRGRYSRPAGMIYNAFDSATQIIPPFEIPVNWPRYVGHDFGPVHTVALWAAMNPATQELFIYREYVMGGLSTFEHVTNWIELSKGERIDTRYGGSSTEDGWRGDFTQAGWRIDKPLITSVEAGIQKVYGYEKLGKKKVFSTCQNYISEKQSYSRELDDMYNATDKIENKSIYHLMDAERYLVSQFNPIGILSGDAELAPVARVV